MSLHTLQVYFFCSSIKTLYSTLLSRALIQDSKTQLTQKGTDIRNIPNTRNVPKTKQKIKKKKYTTNKQEIIQNRRNIPNTRKREKKKQSSRQRKCSRLIIKVQDKRKACDTTKPTKTPTTKMLQTVEWHQTKQDTRDKCTRLIGIAKQRKCPYKT